MIFLTQNLELLNLHGGSDWKKYMHPKYQRRVFFPELWTNKELKDWGEQNLEGHEILANFDAIEI